MTTKSWREVLPIHPAADLFPLMQGDEFDHLVADIKQHGLRERIVTYDDKIIDGRNRALACEKAGVEPQYRPFQGEAKDVVPFIISANIHRRHLTADQKRELIAKVLAANPGKSDRALADQMKVDKNVVSRIRKKVEATGASAPVEKRTGKDGKARKQPAEAVTNAGTKRPFRDLKTGEVVMRYRGRAGYVPMEESERTEERISHIARVADKLIEGNINLARELRDILQRASEFLGKDLKDCCARCLLNVLAARIKSEEQDKSIADRPTTTTAPSEPPPDDDFPDLPACLRRVS